MGYAGMARFGSGCCEICCMMAVEVVEAVRGPWRISGQGLGGWWNGRAYTFVAVRMRGITTGRSWMEWAITPTVLFDTAT